METTDIHRFKMKINTQVCNKLVFSIIWGKYTSSTAIIYFKKLTISIFDDFKESQ